MFNRLCEGRHGSKQGNKPKSKPEAQARGKSFPRLRFGLGLGAA